MAGKVSLNVVCEHSAKVTNTMKIKHVARSVHVCAMYG